MSQLLLLLLLRLLLLLLLLRLLLALLQVFGPSKQCLWQSFCISVDTQDVLLQMHTPGQSGLWSFLLL